MANRNDSCSNTLIRNRMHRVTKHDKPYWEWLHYWYKCWEFILDTDKTNPLVLMKGASQLALLHEEERQARIQSRKQQHNYASSSLYMQYATAILR
jgi:hypothetical protein